MRMEFKFNINNLLGTEICRLDRQLTPHRTSPLNLREYKAQLCEVVDVMGTASGKAQGYDVITSARRLQMADHRMYIMKDAEANNGMGAVVGFVKVGHKRLFIYDQNGLNHEMEPLCTLDFYVHESRQRMGCGHRLFEYMLHEEGVKPHQQAIDRPSHKFLSFLQKHYKLKATVPQNNKFVVFDGFFRDKPANAVIDKRRGPHKPPLHPYKRQTSHDSRQSAPDSRHDREQAATIGRVTESSARPPSGSQVPTSQLEREISTEQWKQVLSSVPLQRQNSRENLKANSDRHLPSLNAERNTMSPLAMGAQGSMYSRHSNMTSPPPHHPHRVGDTIPSKAMDAGSQADHDSTLGIDVGKKIIGGVDPPLRQRDGPPRDYQRLFSPDSYNSHSYQDRNGRLKVAPRQEDSTPNRIGLTYQKSQSTPSVHSTPTLPPGDPYKTNSIKSQTLGSAWNVFGVSPNPPSANPGNPKYNQTRLW